MTKKTGKKTKRVHRTPQELLQAEYERSCARRDWEESVAPSVPIDVLAEQGLYPPSELTPPPLPVSASASVPLADSMAPLLLTVVEVCALLNVSRATFFRLKKAGQIPGCVSLGGQLRYRREDLEQWVKQLETV